CLPRQPERFTPSFPPAALLYSFLDSRTILCFSIPRSSCFLPSLERALVLCAARAEGTRERGCRSPRDMSDGAAPSCARRRLTALLTASALRSRTAQTMVKEKQYSASDRNHSHASCL